MTTTTQVFTSVNHRAALSNNPSPWVLSSSVIVYLIHHMTCGAPHALVPSCRVSFLFQVRMLEDNGTCKSLCVSTIPGEDAKFINGRIREDYALNWLIDGLPAAEMKIDLKSGDMFFDMGFNLGNDDGPNEERPHLNNHYDIVLRYDSCQTS